MDMMAGKDIELQQEGNKPLNYQNLDNASMASMGNTVMNLSACSSPPMVDSFGPFMWEHRLDASNFGYSNMNFHNVGTSTSSPSIRADLGLHQDLVLRKDMSQPSFPSGPSERVPHLPTDSDFIERAARLSSFGGSFAQMLSPFPLPHSMSPFALKPVTGMQSQRDEKNVTEDGKLLKNGKKCGASGLSGNESDDAEYSHERQADDTPENSTPKGLDSKKRKKHAEQDENNEAAKLALQRNKESEDTKPTSVYGGKHGKAQGSDLPKEGYVHVRARRGQATNSHSLAERVRREKISERMKFLQDLVPGCNKVTGKAVMLDEIINYVQSLQRQVEFLSMKLATVYPHMDFNLEEYSSKEGFQSHPGTVPFPSPLHPPQNGLMQLGSSSIIARRPINLPPGFECGTLKQPATQVPGTWADELHNIVHMGFNSNTPSSQDAKDSSPKAKP